MMESWPGQDADSIYEGMLERIRASDPEAAASEAVQSIMRVAAVETARVAAAARKLVLASWTRRIRARLVTGQDLDSDEVLLYGVYKALTGGTLPGYEREEE